MTRATRSLDTITTGEGLVVFRPRDWYPGKSRAVIYGHSLAGDHLSGSRPDTAPGFHNLITKVARRFPVLVPDLGGAVTCGNAAAVNAIAAAKTWAESAALGATAGPALMLTTSMNTWAALRYFADNAFGALVSVVGVIDLDDVRNFNRPGVWLPGGIADAPFNANAINGAWGLPNNSTSDYPVHGSSFAALPAGANPNLRIPELVGLRHLAVYADDDPTALPSITLAHIAACGAPAQARNVGPLGHTDAAIGAANTDEIIDWFLAS